MKQDAIQLIDAGDVEYRYFDEDPDGDPGRAGDGIYFQLPGESDWSGPWHSESEAEGEAHQALEDKEIRSVTRTLKKEGYLCVGKGDHHMTFVTKVDDRWFAIDVTTDRVRARETFGFGQNNDIAVIDFEPKDGVYGYRHQAAMQAVDAIAQEIANQPKLGM